MKAGALLFSLVPFLLCQITSAQIAHEFTTSSTRPSLCEFDSGDWVNSPQVLTEGGSIAETNLVTSAGSLSFACKWDFTTLSIEGALLTDAAASWKHQAVGGNCEITDTYLRWDGGDIPIYNNSDVAVPETEDVFNFWEDENPEYYGNTVAENLARLDVQFRIDGGGDCMWTVWDLVQSFTFSVERGGEDITAMIFEDESEVIFTGKNLGAGMEIGETWVDNPPDPVAYTCAFGDIDVGAVPPERLADDDDLQQQVVRCAIPDGWSCDDPIRLMVGEYPLVELIDNCDGQGSFPLVPVVIGGSVILLLVVAFLMFGRKSDTGGSKAQKPSRSHAKRAKKESAKKKAKNYDGDGASTVLTRQAMH